MSHEIMEYDNVLSIHETPWHGLGIVLPDYVPVREAQKLAGLTWTVRKEPMFYRMPAVEGMSRDWQVPGTFAVVRNDNNLPIGTVGPHYLPYQNDELFSFVEDFCGSAESHLETCGSLKNGALVWGLALSGTTEYVRNDPVRKYFLIKNAFNGQSQIEICFTNVRVVCNNTLTAALGHASNVWRVRHTRGLHGRLNEIRAILSMSQEHDRLMTEAMTHLTAVSLSGEQIEKAVKDLVVGPDIEDEAISTRKRNVIDKILELHESGAGSDIPGVRGTAYGLLNALTEYTDHFKLVRGGRGTTREEARFESVMMGSGADFKQQALDYVLAMAA